MAAAAQAEAETRTAARRCRCCRSCDQGQHSFKWDRAKLPALQRLRLLTAVTRRFDDSVRPVLTELRLRHVEDLPLPCQTLALAWRLDLCPRLASVTFPREVGLGSRA